MDYAWVGQEPPRAVKLGGPARGGTNELRLFDRGGHDAVHVDRAAFVVADRPRTS